MGVTVRHRKLSILGVGLAGALLAGVLQPGVAQAAPGDASARGVVLALAGGLRGTVLVDANAVLGAADAPAGGGTDTDTVGDITAAVTGTVGVTAAGAVDQVSATREATGSSASASVSGLALGVLGVPAVGAGSVQAAVDCPQTGALTADTTVTGLTLFGAAVTLDANTPGVTGTAAVTVPGVPVSVLRVTLTRVETVTGTTATAVAIRATLALDAGTGGLSVRVPLGTVTIASATCQRPAAAPAVPTATGLMPDTGPTAGGTTVTITGTNLAGATEVTFDGLPATIVSRTATTVVVRTPAHPVGTVDVAVTTPGGTATLPGAFTYVAAPPPAAPTATAITPDTGPTAGGTTVTITGTNLAGATEVTFDGLPATIVSRTATTVVVRAPAHPAGTVDVAVTTPGGTATLPDAFTYVAAPPPAAPTATAITPDTGPTAGGQTVTITGTGFGAGTTVTFDGVPATNVVVAADGTSLTAVTPPNAAGPAAVVVRTAAGSAGPLDYTYVAPGGGGGGGDAAPTVDALTPDRGPTTGGQTVVITGSGFADGATVTFDGVPATSVVVVDDDTIIVRTPAGAAGPADVVVTVDGVASDPLTYTYVPGTTVPAAPTADALDPETGPTSGGTSVTVTGSGFVPGQTSVLICGTTLLPADVDVADSGSLSFTTPPCAAGPTDVVVVTPGGATAALGFTYTDGSGTGTGTGTGDGTGDGTGSGTGTGSGVGGLPNTGADVLGISVLGLALLVGGAVLARLARRRSVVVPD